MQTSPSEHRNHAIFTHASGPTGGPWIASYSAWKIEPNNSYRATIQGMLLGVFPSIQEAQSAAAAEAKMRLDQLLDSTQ